MRDMDYGVKLVTRDEWGARKPRSVTPLNPVYGATRHWEGPHMGTFPHDSCPSKVRGIQNYHMDHQGWTDIAYTGVVCPHRYVFEGRSLWVRTAANGTTTGNDTAYAFCYLGGEGDPFTEDGKAAMKAAMNWTRTYGGAGPHRNDHNDWKNTQCPGVDIETWGDSGEPITWTPAPSTPKGRSTAMMDMTTHPDGNRVDLVVIGGDRKVYHYRGDTPADLVAAGGGEDLGGQAKSVTATWAGGEYVIVTQGMDDELWTRRYVNDEVGWTDWENNPPGKMIAPAANL